jgi:hypothetical protein
MELIRGVFKATLITDLEMDTEHFGFDIQQLTGDGWREVIAYYPTMIPLDADEALQGGGLRCIMDEVHSPLRQGKDIAHQLERLSWMAPDWFDEDDALARY